MNKNKLIDAYIDLMAHIYEAMDDTLHSFADALAVGKDKIAQQGQLNHEEIQHVSASVQRDIEHAAHNLPEQTDHNSLADWFKFDIELIENFALDAFLSIADKTRLELARLGQIAQKHSYQSGEITGPGTFICDVCGKEIAFKTPSEIPECPQCHAHTFVRM
ncbi:MAG: zinc ribbon-containing protein [Methylovulum sp.]|jgi:rubrerythrin|nr:zinc ribbon-containing protein [Methylovulum sp.]TSA41890.1 MAG: hypothetical protein D4R63_02035 [Methylococcaceae bacterium]